MIAVPDAGRQFSTWNNQEQFTYVLDMVKAAVRKV